MTSAGPQLRDGPRVHRLRLLTRLAVVAWVAALGLALVPVVAGGAAGPARTAPSVLDAKPSKSPAAPTAKPRPTSKPQPTRNPRVTPTPQPTATPQATATSHPTPVPRSTPGVAASPTPRPTRGNAGGGGKPSSSPSSKGGVVPGTKGGGGNSSNGPGPTTSGSSRDSAGATRPHVAAAAPFSIPGSVPTGRAKGQPDRGSERLFDGAIFLDFDFATSVDLLTPAALLALPGLLIVLSLAAQVAGGVLWIPITRRLLVEAPDAAGGRGARWRR